ncbi:MAG: alpha/beta fold hydrolase [Alphaproteobacteria bacterium]|nr:alpha/beta fold hydrolase [Alphaproteobacteria bacterium]
MRIFLALLALVAALAVAGGVVLYRQAATGAPASDLENTYMTPADRFLNVNGARVRIREEGSPDADPILLLHGFTHSLETWDAWAADLARDHRVVRYDLLGHGLTGPDPKRRYAPAERAAFIGDVMDALRIDRAIIAGNSLGGLAAWRFAAMSPERVAALVLISPAAYPYNGVGDVPLPIPAPMEAFLMAAPAAGVKASAELVYGEQSVSQERLAVWRDMMRREGNGEAMIHSLEEFTLPDPSADLARVVAPTLLIWGAEDAVVPIANGERMAQSMPNATLKVYEGIGHAAQEEAPEMSLRDVRAFLAGREERMNAAPDETIDQSVELNPANERK